MTAFAPPFARVNPLAPDLVCLARAAARRRWWLVIIALLGAKSAFAAGFFLTDRGVRPLSRGGAFVAGADDLGSIWYNPAGLTETGDQLMVDASYLQFNSSFTRQTQVIGSSGQPVQVNFPKVEGNNPFLPIPTIAGSTDFGLKTWNFAFAIHAPYTPLPDYPDEIDDGSPTLRPAPQRYSLLSPKGSLLSVIGLYASKSFFDGKLSIGLGPELLLGEFVSRVALSSCPPDRLLCAEQDPAYDSITQLKAGVIVAPSASFGITYRITPMWRVGFSGHLPFWVDTPAKIQVQLPSAPLFNGVTVQGDQARVKFVLPLILRLGVEVRPVKDLRIEATGVYEAWSMHNKIEINSVGQGVTLQNIPGFPANYKIGNLSMPRNFRDTFSIRLGGEYGRRVGEKFGWAVRGGFMYERSAVPPNSLTVLTIDMDKVTPTLGFSLKYAGFTAEILYAHVFAFGVNVNPATANVPALNPVRASGTTTTAVNGGQYRMDANVIGLGVSYRFDWDQPTESEIASGREPPVRTETQWGEPQLIDRTPAPAAAPAPAATPTPAPADEPSLVPPPKAAPAPAPAPTKPNTDERAPLIDDTPKKSTTTM